ncbi:MAG: hypothetical protein K2K74_01290 [Lachnospiraceae bacterium]|nr:hypothetical protein [Lachnospiraceae bacterium]MDE6619124.1 hypothetical protein [Lachnospiraceae bacterium]
MKAGSMEGLIGANLNMKLSRTPMRVFKEAERKGDTEVMKRAMGYVTEFQEKAHECSDRAQEELAKELKEERKEEEIRREQAQERKEETKKYVEKIQENNKADTPKTDSVEISEEGKLVLKSDFQTEDTAPNAEKTDVKMYTDEGKAKAVDSVEEDVGQKIDITV